MLRNIKNLEITNPKDSYDGYKINYIEGGMQSSHFHGDKEEIIHLWGLNDSNGNIIIKPIYRHIYTIVYDNSCHFLIDGFAYVIKEFPPEKEVDYIIVDINGNEYNTWDLNKARTLKFQKLMDTL